MCNIKQLEKNVSRGLSVTDIYLKNRKHYDINLLI